VLPFLDCAGPGSLNTPIGAPPATWPTVLRTDSRSRGHGPLTGGRACPRTQAEHLRRVSWYAFAACRLAVVENRDMPKVPGALEVMPPPPVGPDEERAALQSLIARSRTRDLGPMVDFSAYRTGPDDPVQVDFDEEPTLTAPVMPGLVSKDGERPTDLSSVIAGDFQISGRHVGLILVVVDSEPRRRELHGWHGAPPRAARLVRKSTRR
jgi:hypothetical protein